MSGRGERVYHRRDSGRTITDEEIYTMVMLYQYQHRSIRDIAQRFAIDPVEARILIGKRISGSCCG